MDDVVEQETSGPRGPRAFRAGLAAAVVALAAASMGCGRTGPGDTGDAVTVGLLLPFTGDASATSSNFERAVLFAADRINAGGGIHGRPLRVVSGDTHSDLGRSRQAVQSLITAGAVVVIGPESSDIAAEIGPILADNRVAFLSPLVGAGNDRTVGAVDDLLRRLAHRADHRSGKAG